MKRDFPDPDFFPFRIPDPDPGVKKAPDPGSAGTCWWCPRSHSCWCFPSWLTGAASHPHLLDSAEPQKINFFFKSFRSEPPTFWHHGPGSSKKCLCWSSGSCYFRQWPSIWQLKNFFSTFFCLLFFEATKVSRKQEEWRFFLLVLLDDRRIRNRIHTSY